MRAARVLTIAAVLAASTALTPAFAADLPVKAPPPAPVAVSDWTGLYIGVNGGWGWGTTDYNFAPGGSGNGFNLFSNDITGSLFSHDLSGGTFGVHVGYNQQYGNIVLGAEGTFNWSDIRGTATNPLAPFVPATATYDTNVRWFATSTTRAGLAFNNWLVYIKGGMAAGRVNSRLTSTSSVDCFLFTGSCSFRVGRDQIGWTVGGGVEYAFARNWIFGIEGNYYDLQNHRFGGEVVPNTTFPVDYHAHTTFATVLGRISYKWDAIGPGPAAAPGMYTKAPVVASATNWTGFYLGVNAGYGWGDADYRFAAGGAGGPPPGLFSPYATGGSFTQSMDGGVFGIQSGFNQQWGNFVVGLESLLEWTDISGSSSNVFAGLVSPGDVTYRTKVKWFTTLTPRIGLTWANWLFYVKGGLAAGRVDSNLATTNTFFGVCPAGCRFDDHHDHIGWTVGGGIDYAFTPSWVLGVEASYYDLGSQRYGGRTNPDTTWPVDYRVHPTFATVLARISYKFGAGGLPLISASY